jgi:hypothetical protein
MKLDVLALAMACCLVPTLRMQSPDSSTPPRVRYLEWSPGWPIPERLRPDDQVVVITLEGADMVTPARRLSAKDVIDDAAVRADVVAVVDVERIDALLASKDAWIQTRLTGTISRILRINKGRRFRLGQHVDARVSGGELAIGQVTVRATDSRPFISSGLREHRSYLLFLTQDGDVLDALHPPVLVENARLSYPSPWRHAYANPDPLAGMTLNAAEKVVRRARTSWLLK